MNLLEKLKAQRAISATEGGLTQSDLPALGGGRSPLAIQKFSPGPMVAKTPEEALEMLSDSVRAKAKERLSFCKMVFEVVKTKGISEQRACEDIAIARASNFPELLEAGKNGASALSYRNYREWISRFDRDASGRIIFDITKVADNYARGLRGHRSGHPRFWQLFDAFYLNENRLPATQAMCLAIDRIKREIPDAPVATIHQVQYHIDQIPLPELILARWGEEAFKAQCMDYMTRDWSGYFAGEALVADSRDFDFPLRVWEAGKDGEEGRWVAKRPKICAMMCCRTWRIVSYWLTVEPINQRVIMDTLALGIFNMGFRVPKLLYFDNGKDYNAKGFMEPYVTNNVEHSILRELGCRLVNSIVYNARAKTIERMFGDMMKQFDKLFTGYLGSRPGERSADAQYYYKHPEHLPSLGQFIPLFDGWVRTYHATPKKGDIHKGKSPNELWADKQPQPGFLEAVTPQALHFAFLKPEGTRIVDRGPCVKYTHSNDKEERVYYSDALWPYDKKPVLIKVDRLNPEHVYAYTLDGALISECNTRIRQRALDGDRKALAIGISRQRAQIRHTYTMIEQRTGGLHRLSPLELFAAPAEIKIITGEKAMSVKGSSHTRIGYLAEGGIATRAVVEDVVDHDAAIHVEAVVESPKALAEPVSPQDDAEELARQERIKARAKALAKKRANQLEDKNEI